MRGVDASSGWTALLAGFVVAGAGIGMTNPPLASTAVGLVEPQRSGMASGINNTFRQVGIATGTAGLGALFQHLLENRVTDAFPRAARLPVEAYASGDPGPFARLPGGREAYLGAFTGALNGVLLTAACVALAGAALSLVLIRRPSAPAAQQADRPPAAGAVRRGRPLASRGDANATAPPRRAGLSGSCSAPCRPRPRSRAASSRASRPPGSTCPGSPCPRPPPSSTPSCSRGCRPTSS